MLKFRLQKKKAECSCFTLALHSHSAFLVAGINEISNFDLVRDLSEIIDYMSFTGHILH